jgi:hypothetical protein
MYMGGACETWKWAILDVRNIIARPSAKYGCSWSNNTNSWKFAITTLNVHAWYFPGITIKNLSFCQWFPCIKFSVSIRSYSRCFNTHWLHLYNRQLCNFLLFCEGQCQPFARWVIYTHIFYWFWQSSYKNHLPFDKFISLWYVTKNMTILFLAQRFQIVAISNFLTQPPNCLLRFCWG